MSYNPNGSSSRGYYPSNGYPSNGYPNGSSSRGHPSNGHPSNGHPSNALRGNNPYPNLCFPGSEGSINTSFYGSPDSKRKQPLPQTPSRRTQREYPISPSRGALTERKFPITRTPERPYASPRMDYSPGGKMTTKYKTTFSPYPSPQAPTPRTLKRDASLSSGLEGMRLFASDSDLAGPSSRRPSTSRSPKKTPQSQHSEQISPPRVRVSTYTRACGIQWPIVYIQSVDPPVDVCTKIMPECVVRCKIAIALVCETRKPSLTDRPEANWYFNTRSPGDRDLAARIVFESNPGMGNAWHGPSVYSSMCRQEVIKKGHYPVDYSVGSEPMDICVELPGYKGERTYRIPIQCDHGRMTMSGLFFGLGVILEKFVEETPRQKAWFSSMRHVYISEMYKTKADPHVWRIQVAVYF